MDTYILIRGARQLLTLHGRPGVRRIDLMNDLGLIEDGSVLIRNNEIAAVGPTRRLENMHEARTAAVISAHGRVVLPGFVDPTLRLLMGSSSRLSRKPSVSRISQEASAVLRSALHHGTTRAEVKVGGATAAEELRSLKSTRRVDPGGEDFIRTWLIRPWVEHGTVDPIQARVPTFEYVRTKIRGGFVEVEAGGESSEFAAGLFMAAARNELLAKLTWLGPPDDVLAELLSRFRIHTVTGLERLETSFISKLRDSQTMLVAAGAESALAENAGEIRIREFLDAGGSLALATGYDPVRSPMFNMQMTIAWAVLRMKLTAEEAITAATLNAAYASGIGATAGSLEYGKSADLLLLNLADYRELPRQFGVNHVGMVIRAGAVVFNRIGWKAPRAEPLHMIECVPNFSEGRDLAKIDAIQEAIASVQGTLVLHRTSDVDHNRSVITFAGPVRAVAESAFRAAEMAAKVIDLREHEGVHPRVGALDVLPFIPLQGATLEECVELAHATGGRIWRELGVPVYFYEAAARRPDRRKLEDVRRGEFEGLRESASRDEAKRPDVGGPGLHPSAGAVIAGARKFLIAFNINLQTDNLGIAQEIARRIRTSSGGLPAVKALGLPLSSRGLVQVSMNLTDFERTGLDMVYAAVKRLAAAHGVEIEESELIGLMPRSAIERAATGFLKLKNFDSDRVIENRIESLRTPGPLLD